MTTVYCNNSDCRYLKNGMECDRAMISLDEDGECEDFEDYRDGDEWQTPFWKRMLDPERKKEVRVQYKGKEVEVGGRIFYVDSNSYFAVLTDKETGLACRTLNELNENVDLLGKIEECAKKYALVTELPIAEYDEKSRKFSYPEEATDERGEDDG